MISKICIEKLKNHYALSDFDFIKEERSMTYNEKKNVQRLQKIGDYSNRRSIRGFI